MHTFRNPFIVGTFFGVQSDCVHRRKTYTAKFIYDITQFYELSSFNSINHTTDLTTQLTNHATYLLLRPGQ